MKAEIYEGLRYWAIMLTELKKPYRFLESATLMWSAGYFFVKNYPELAKKRVVEFISIHTRKEYLNELKKPQYTKVASFRFSHGEEFARKLATFIKKRGERGMPLGVYRLLKNDGEKA